MSAGTMDSEVYAMIAVMSEACWPLKAVTPSGKRHAGRVAGEQQQREQVGVPATDERQHAHRHHSWPRERKQDPPEVPDARDAIDKGRFLELLRQIAATNGRMMMTVTGKRERDLWEDQPQRLPTEAESWSRGTAAGSPR